MKKIILFLFFCVTKPIDFQYKDEWDCVLKILFNMDLMKALIEMEDIHCERDVLNFHDLFDQIESKREQNNQEKSSLEKENDENEQNDQLQSRIEEFQQDIGDVQSQVDYERNLIFDQIQVHPDDYENNAESFEKAFQQKVKNAIYHKDEGLGEQTQAEFKAFTGSILKIEPTQGVVDNLVWINKIDFNRKYDRQKEKISKIKKSGQVHYKFQKENIAQDRVPQKIMSKINKKVSLGFSKRRKSIFKTEEDKQDHLESLKQSILFNVNEKIEEDQTEVNADLERQEYFVNLDDEINVPEVDTEKIHLYNFLVKPIVRMHIENYNQKDDGPKKESLSTYYSKLEIVKDNGHNHRLLELDMKDEVQIADEFMNYFKLLPPCIQKAIFQCNVNYNKILERCEKDYEQIIQGKRNKKCIIYNNTDVRASLQCNDDETFFNNACYKKCPIGFKDAKIFCMKNKYIKRKVVLYNFQQINPQKEIIWGSKYVLTKCSIYGKYYESAGSDYCKMICPKGWRNFGTVCKKPFRFLNQKVFVFSQDDIIADN